MDEQRILRRKWLNILQAALVLGGMAGLLALMGWMLAGPVGILWAAVFGVIFMALSPRFSPALVLRMYGAWRLHPAEFPGLFAMVQRLADRAGVERLPTLYYVPSAAMNAFTVGHGDDTALAITDGLLRGLTRRELCGVLAHELSHVQHNDMWIMALADSVSRIVGMLSLFGQLLLLVSLPLYLLNYGGIPWLLILLLLFAPTISALLQLVLSRNREYDADMEAVRITGDPDGLATALQKLDLQQSRMWERVAMPGPKLPVPSLLRTHPRTEDRVARIRSLRAEPEVDELFEGGEWDFLHRTPHATRGPRRPGLWARL